MGGKRELQDHFLEANFIDRFNQQTLSVWGVQGELAPLVLGLVPFSVQLIHLWYHLHPTLTCGSKKLSHEQQPHPGKTVSADSLKQVEGNQ